MSPGQTLCLASISCIISNVTAVPLVSTWRQPLNHCHSVTFRVATPFGGFGKAPRPAPIKALQVEPLPDYPELQGETQANRPSFNRSALGWVSVGGPVPLTTVPLEPVLIPESEDLWTRNEVAQRCCLFSCCRGYGERGNVSVSRESGREKERPVGQCWFNLPCMQHPWFSREAALKNKLIDPPVQ